MIITNKAGFVTQMEKQVYQALIGLIPQLSIRANESMKLMYNGFFGRDPIASGESKRVSDGTAIQNPKGSGLLVVFQVIENQSRARTWGKRTKQRFKVEDYAMFFAEPLVPKNPNFKYGRRNPATSARDHFMKKLGI